MFLALKIFINNSKINSVIIKQNCLYTNASISKRFIQTSSRQLNLSDPFKPKKRDTIFDDDYRLNEKNKYGFKQSSEPNDTTLAKVVKFAINTTPLNIKFRKQFNLNDDFKLIYSLTNEQVYLISNSMINFLFPLVVALVGFIFVTELTGRSKFSESFDDFYSFSAFLIVWISVIYGLARKIQKSTIMRIYHNPVTNKYIAIRLKGLFNFVKDDFNKSDIVYRFHEKNKLGSLAKKFGNVCIKNEPRLVEFDLFKSNEVLEDLFGSESFKVLKTKYKL